MKSIVYWYTSEVFKWRTGAAVAWLLILLPTLVSIYITAANFCILHPFLWISSTFGCILKLSTWGYIILLSVLTALTVICDSAYYTVQGNVIGNRAGYLWTLVQLSHVFHGAVHAVAGGVITWCCVQIVGGGYQGLSLQCEPARTSACLNEHHLFIVFHGVYAGYFYSVTFFLQNKNYLEFPVIQQAKFFQVKSGISPQLLESTVTTLKLMRFYYLGYFLIGAIPKEWIIYTLNLEKSPAAPLNSVFGLLDISLFWQTLVTSVFLHFVWSLGVVLFKAYNTEPLQLPIESSFGEESSRCLHHALSCKLSILQYLGYLDLYLLSKFSKERRKQIYSLSQPGGHPHNWTSLCTQCLTGIDALTSAVRQHNDNTVGNGALPLRQPSGERATNRDKGNFLGFNPAMTSIRNHTSHVSRDSPYGIMDVTSPSVIYRGPQVNGFKSPASGPAPLPKQPSIADKIAEYIKKRKAVSYFLSDFPEAKSQRLFADCKVQIWAVEALSYLVASSYHEDTFGVVQKSLPAILTSMLSLQESVEKCFKLSTGASRRVLRGQNDPDGLRFALKASLRTCLYRVVNKFKDHLSIMQLPPDQTRKLKQFMEYKE